MTLLVTLLNWLFRWPPVCNYSTPSKTAGCRSLSGVKLCWPEIKFFRWWRLPFVASSRGQFDGPAGSKRNRSKRAGKSLPLKDSRKLRPRFDGQGKADEFLQWLSMPCYYSTERLNQASCPRKAMSFQKLYCWNRKVMIYLCWLGGNG